LAGGLSRGSVVVQKRAHGQSTSDIEMWLSLQAYLVTNKYYRLLGFDHISTLEEVAAAESEAIRSNVIMVAKAFQYPANLARRLNAIPSLARLVKRSLISIGNCCFAYFLFCLGMIRCAFMFLIWFRTYNSAP
jgi:hypothetical protein